MMAVASVLAIRAISFGNLQHHRTAADQIVL
jgi:hypothetical protein